MTNRVLLLVVWMILLPSLAVAGPSQPLDKEQASGHVLNCQHSSGHHLYFMDFTCPIGGEQFKSLVLGTHSTFGRHLDWEPVSYMEFPAPLAVCPSNGFVISKEKYTDAELAKMGNVIASEEYKKVFSEKHASYYFFFRLNQMLNENVDEHWWFLLNATWEAEQCKDSEKYQLYAQEAIKAAKLTLERHSTKDDLYWVFNIVIPNLHRRIGDFESAQTWLNNFGDQLPEVEKSKEFYELAFKLLRQAVSEKDTSKIPIKDPINIRK